MGLWDVMRVLDFLVCSDSEKMVWFRMYWNSHVFISFLVFYYLPRSTDLEVI